MYTLFQLQQKSKMGFLSAVAAALMLGAAPSLTQEIISGGDAKPMSRPGVYDVPHDRHPWAGFLFNLTIGNPPQTIPMFNDWTWVQQYTLTTKCMGDVHNTAACLHPDQPFYNQSQSKTFRNVTDRFPRRNWNPNHFFFYEDMWVEHAKEVVTVGSATSTVVFEAADFSFDSTAMAFPFAGVYGMSPVFQGDARESIPR